MSVRTIRGRTLHLRRARLQDFLRVRRPFKVPKFDRARANHYNRAQAGRRILIWLFSGLFNVCASGFFPEARAIILFASMSSIEDMGVGKKAQVCGTRNNYLFIDESFCW